MIVTQLIPQSAAGALRLCAAAALLFALSLPGHAQTKPSSASIEAAREILILKGAGNMFLTLVPSVIDQNKGLLVQQNPMLQKDANEVAEQLRTAYAPRSQEIMTEISTLYASHFTEDEMKQLLTFYKTPLGRKVVNEEPKAAEQSIGFAQNFAVKFAEEVLAKMREELKKKGHTL